MAPPHLEGKNNEGKQERIAGWGTRVPTDEWRNDKVSDKRFPNPIIAKLQINQGGLGPG